MRTPFIFVRTPFKAGCCIQFTINYINYIRIRKLEKQKGSVWNNATIWLLPFAVT
jgi:hypothetical protein